MTARPDDGLTRRVEALARMGRAPSPVVSVFLDTRWTDEQQRERVRLFLKNELRRAREGAGPELAVDLAWIEAQGASLVEQTAVPEASGVALFACQAIGLREVLPVRIAFENAFVIADEPWLRPFADVLAEARPALVAFVDGESARLIPLLPAGVGEEIALRHDVEGRHSSGGWAQNRYQRHIEEHRGQHYDAVAQVLRDVVDAQGIDRLVLAGEERAVRLFRKHLPADLDRSVAAEIPGARHEPAGVLAERAADLLRRLGQSDVTAQVDDVLSDAAAGGRAAAGVGPTLEAVRRNAVQSLYLIKDFSKPGAICKRCETVEAGATSACPACGGPMRPVELGSALVDRVLAAGGTAEEVEVHRALQEVGGVAARLRYAA